MSPDDTVSTSEANIYKSGSATDIKKPKKNPAAITNQSILVFARAFPICAPMGVMPISTPIKKIVRPGKSNTEPVIKRIRTGVSRGESVKCNKSTNITIGSTEGKTSLNFSFITFNVAPAFLNKTK